jgi:hypothetical protein
MDRSLYVGHKAVMRLLLEREQISRQQLMTTEIRCCTSNRASARGDCVATDEKPHIVGSNHDSYIRVSINSLAHTS